MKSSNTLTPICNGDAGKVDQVFKWILTGATEHDVAEAIGQAWPGQEPKPLIVAAVQQLCSAARFEPDLVLGWCMESTRDLYRRMVEIGDFPGALRAVKQLPELAAKA